MSVIDAVVEPQAAGSGFWSDGIRLEVSPQASSGSPSIGLRNALDDRLALIASLRAGWDGPGSAAPPRSALSAVWVATQALGASRTSLGVSAHADGYIAVTVEGLDERRYADVYAHHVEYEVVSEGSIKEWSGPLNFVGLRAFLAADD